MPAPRRRSRGLSLVELLVVLAILAVVSTTVVSLTNQVDARSRYEDTARRLQEIRSSVLGPDAVGADGSMLTGGYLQDTGWLPDRATDLLSRPNIAVGTPMPELRYDPLWRTWAGWRGPYVTAPPMRKGETVAALYDGWGNDFYGWYSERTGTPSWQIPRLAGPFMVRSTGSDGRADDASGGTGVFESDLPRSDQPLIGSSEWITDLRGLQVQVTNLSAANFSASTVQARFRFIIPRWDHASDTAGPLGYWPTAPDSDEFIGSTFTLDVPPPSETEGKNQRTYNFRSDSLRSLRIPHGRRMLFIVDGTTGQPLSGVLACAEVIVSRRVSPPSTVRLTIRNTTP